MFKIDAENLRTKFNGDLKLLNAEITDIVKEIQNAIRDANDNNQDNLSYHIKTNFTVNNFSNKDAQRYVYSTIFKELKKANFTAKLVKKDSSFYFNINWKTSFSPEEIKAQDQLLAEALNPSNNK